MSFRLLAAVAASFPLMSTSLTSLGLCTVIAALKNALCGFGLDHTDTIQKFHHAPTPRIGGIAVLGALWVGCYLSSPEVSAVMWPMLLAGLPAFFAGVFEDVTRRVSVPIRLSATMLSGLIAWYITSVHLAHVAIPGVDWAFAKFPILAIAFTIFAVAGVANSINIIDGFNGLAGTTLIVAFSAFHYMAHLVGDEALASTMLIFIVAVLGFWLVNWPFGKIFLGDGGAYYLGFILAWASVSLVAQHATISPFAVLLACFYPVTEVLYSMYRRRKNAQNPGHPDDLHFHSLIFKVLVRPHLGRMPIRLSANSVTGIVVGLLSIPPAVVAVLCFDSSLQAFSAFFIFLIGYVVMYRHLAR